MLLVPIILYLYSFDSIAFEEDLYKNEFLKYNVYASLNDYDIDKVNSEVIKYLKNKKGNKLIDNEFFNEREQLHLLNVKNLIKKAIAECTKRKTYIGICGEAPSTYPEFAEFLVEQGIDSISLSTDTVISTTLIIAKKEKQLKLKRQK